MPVPVILLAFADYRTDDDQHLRELGAEQDGIVKALQPAEAAGLCRVEVIADVSAEKIVEAFNRWPVAVFHYAGHANGYALLLKKSLDAEGLAAFLGKQSHLELVFLNACATREHATRLRAAGVPRVITTARAINDTTAREFATDFYRHLGAGKTIDHAYAQYPHRHEMEKTDLRGLYWKNMPAEFIEGFPWQLQPESAEAAAWSLSLATDNPLYGLPPIPPRYDLPEEPFRYLQWFERRHAEVFFGRGHQIKELYELITSEHRSPVIMLYGKSGVGKSSLLYAGLFPRLEEAYDIDYLRRDPDRGLSAMLHEVFGDPSDLLKAWKAREQASGKPFLLILDQVEEAFTRPLGKPAEELAAFARHIHAVLGDPGSRPAGGLMLAFRKEYYPEINKSLKEADVPRSGLFLEPLNRKNIIAAIHGLTQNGRLQNHYKLTVEKGLAAKIADDLLEDRESAVAPVLQILLTRMWERAVAAQPHAPAFTHDRYLSLKKEGLLLGDFLDRQLARLEKARPEWVKSGLVHDMLFRFTTPAGTSARLSGEGWQAMYDLPQDQLGALRQQLIDAYLILPVGEGAYQLAHDTLAPLVRIQYDLSDRPGQRAERLLRSKIRLGADASMLSEQELGIVEAGRKGRKRYSEDEEALIRKAAAHWEASKKNELAEAATLEAIQVLSSNPTLAYEKAGFAWRTARLPEALRALHAANYADGFAYDGALYGAPFYRELSQERTYIDYVCFHPGGQQIWAALKDGRVRVYDLEGHLQLSVDPKAGRIYSIRFDRAGERVLLACADQSARLYRIQPDRLEAQRVLAGHQDRVKQAIFGPDEKTIITAGLESVIRVWDLQGNCLQTLDKHTDRVSGLCLGPDGLLFSASNDDTARIWRKGPEGYKGAPVCTDSPEKLLQHDGFVLSVDTKVVNELLMYAVTGSWDRTARAWLITGKSGASGEVVCYQIREFLELADHADRVHHVCFSPNGELILTTSWDTRVRLWDLEGNCLTTLQGHREGVFSANFSPDGRYVVSGSSDGRVLLWDLKRQLIREEEATLPEGAFRETRTRAISARRRFEREAPDGSYRLEYDGRTARIFYPDDTSATLPAPTGGGIEQYADFSPDSRFFLLPNGLRQCKVYDRHCHEIATFAAPRDDMLIMARFSPGGDHIITLSGSGKACFWPFLANA